MDRFLWRGKVGPAFWNIASIISLTINIILFAVIIILGKELFEIKNALQTQLLDGLYTNFVQMDSAHIITEIPITETIVVKDTIPVVFDLPLSQKTKVILTKDTPVKNATIYLNNRAVPLDIILRKGTPLNIALDLVVPVSQTIPVELKVPVQMTVPVDISIAETQLHTPFVGLQETVLPYQLIMEDMPNSWYDTPFCGPLTNWFCKYFLETE
jgi:hypothetical protein